MAFPNFKNKHLEEALFSAEDYANYNKWDKRNFPKKILFIYQGAPYRYFKRKYGKSLRLHSKTNELLSKFDAKDFDEFISLLRKVNLGKFNRDNPFSGLNLFLKPDLIFFLTKKYFQNKAAA